MNAFLSRNKVWPLAFCSALLMLELSHRSQAATPPPLERYTCYQVHAASLTYTYMGYFVLQKDGKYAWGFGKGKADKKGTYVYDAKGMHFKTGPLKGINGTFETEKNGRHTFELKIQGKKQYASDDGIITWYANCDKHDPHDKK